ARTAGRAGVAGPQWHRPHPRFVGRWEWGRDPCVRVPHVPHVRVQRDERDRAAGPGVLGAADLPTGLAAPVAPTGLPTGPGGERETVQSLPAHRVAGRQAAARTRMAGGVAAGPAAAGRLDSGARGLLAAR